LANPSLVAIPRLNAAVDAMTFEVG
jgi:hypothetical protein